MIVAMRPVTIALVLAACSSDSTCLRSPHGVDPTYANGTISISQTAYEFSNATLDGEDRLLVTGNEARSGGHAFIARFDRNGHLDPSFADHGFLDANFNLPDDHIHALAVDAQGRIVVAGVIEGGSTPALFAVRLHSDGTPDTTFGMEGMWSEVQSSPAADVVGTVVPDRDGIYITGTGFLFRLLNDGTLDGTFPRVTDVRFPVAGVAVADGVVLSDYGAQSVVKYDRQGARNPTFGGKIFPGADQPVYAFTSAGDAFYVGSAQMPARIAKLDVSGAVVAMSADIATSIQSLRVACDRIAVAGYASPGIGITLFGLDLKPVAGDPPTATYVVQGPTSFVGGIGMLVQSDGAVVTAGTIGGTNDTTVDLRRFDP